MSVLFFWRGDNYLRDIQTGKAYHLNQNNELIYNLNLGEHIWAFTRRQDKTYVLALDLIVTGTKKNQVSDSGYEYGEYHADGNKQKSHYFDVLKGPDAEPVIKSLFFWKSLSSKAKALALGSLFQGRNGVRLLTIADEGNLIRFSSGLPTI
ncbi:hypothetical protein ACFLVW_07540 [Chloroflexota bacterium]